MLNSAGTPVLKVSGLSLLAYLPLYIGIDSGIFKTHQLEIAHTPHVGPWSDLITSVNRDAIDIAVGNLWFAMQNWCHPGTLLPVAHCSQQCGTLIARKAGRFPGKFAWADLEGKSIAIQSNVPTPWIAFQECLVMRNIPLNRVKTLVGLSADDAIDALGCDAIDYALLNIDQTEDPNLEEAAALSSVLGPLPWSLFLANRKNIRRHPEIFVRFQTAISSALEWIHEQPTDSIADLINSRFPNRTHAELVNIIDRNRALDTWPLNSKIDMLHADRWQEIALRFQILEKQSPIRDLLLFANEAVAP